MTSFLVYGAWRRLLAHEPSKKLVSGSNLDLTECIEPCLLTSTNMIAIARDWH
jgi:hypothetical protein